MIDKFAKAAKAWWAGVVAAAAVLDVAAIDGVVIKEEWYRVIIAFLFAALGVYNISNKAPTP